MENTWVSVELLEMRNVSNNVLQVPEGRSWSSIHVADVRSAMSKIYRLLYGVPGRAPLLVITRQS